jgi:hypothetical protein
VLLEDGRDVRVDGEEHAAVWRAQQHQVAREHVHVLWLHQVAALLLVHQLVDRVRRPGDVRRHHRDAQPALDVVVVDGCHALEVAGGARVDEVHLRPAPVDVLEVEHHGRRHFLRALVVDAQVAERAQLGHLRWRLDGDRMYGR